MKIARPVRELGTRAPWLHEGGVRAVEIARDGNILTIGNDGEVRRWMLATGEMATRTSRGPRDGYASDLFLLPEIERYLAFFVFQGGRLAFRTWDLRSGAYLGEVALADGLQEQRTVIAVDRDGRRALHSTNAERAEPVLVSIEDGSMIGRLDGAHERGVFLSTGEIVAPDIGGEIRVWDPEGTRSRALLAPRPPPLGVEDRTPMRVQQIFASRTHPLFAVAYDYRVVVFSNDGKELFELAEHYPPVVFSPSGERIALNASGRIVIYDLAGAEKGAVSTDAIPLDSFAIGLDHRVIVGAQSSGELHARSTATALPSPGAAAERKATVLPGEITTISTAPTGGNIAFGCTSGDLLLWEPGQSVPARLPGTGRASPTLRYLPDGRLVVVSYQMLRVLSPSTHELFAEIAGANDLLSPDGRLGCSYSNAGRLIVYETENGVVRSDVVLEDTSIPPPTQGFQLSSDSTALAADGSFAWLKESEIRVWGLDGRLRAKNSLATFATLPDSPFLYSRSIAYLTNDELLVSDSLSGIHILHTGRNQWETLTQEKDMQLTALDPARRRAALSRKIPELDEWGVSVFDLDSRSMLFDAPSDGGGHHTRAEFLADGSLVTATVDRRLVVWESP